MDKNPGCQCKLFQFVNTRHPEKAHSNCSKVAAEHEGRGFFITPNEAAKATNRLLDYIRAADHAGYDPYDALNSPILRALSFKNKWARVALIQFFRRSPVNLRAVFGIKPGHNPKGIGLFLWGYTKLYALERRAEYLETIKCLLDLLEKLKSRGYSGNCWGYNFDWQSRGSLLPKFTPTVVNSSFIGHALIDTYRCTGIQRALDMAVSIKDFILNDLNRYEENGAQCFSYTPIDGSKVHNANMLGVSLLIRIHGILGEERLKQEALAALAYSIRYQQGDGSWYYGEADYQKWIDSFHTGFNLQALRYFLDEGYEEYRLAFDKGVEYYAENFFLEDGTPKYYHDRLYPIDIHSPAQAICFFSRQGQEYQNITDKIVRWMLTNMCSNDGYFYFRKGRFVTNKIPYMRWSQAWAFHALTEYLCAKHKEAKAHTTHDVTLVHSPFKRSG